MDGINISTHWIIIKYSFTHYELKRGREEGFLYFYFHNNLKIDFFKFIL